MNHVDDELRDREDATNDASIEDAFMRKDGACVSFGLLADDTIIMTPSRVHLQTSAAETICGVVRQADGFRVL